MFLFRQKSTLHVTRQASDNFFPWRHRQIDMQAEMWDVGYPSNSRLPSFAEQLSPIYFHFICWLTYSNLHLQGYLRHFGSQIITLPVP